MSQVDPTRTYAIAADEAGGADIAAFARRRVGQGPQSCISANNWPGPGAGADTSTLCGNIRSKSHLVVGDRLNMLNPPIRDHVAKIG